MTRRGRCGSSQPPVSWLTRGSVTSGFLLSSTTVSRTMARRSKSYRPEPGTRPSVSARTETEDERLFQPVSERSEFTHSDPWRVLRITGEFVAGFDDLSDIVSAVAIFGSARTPPNHPWYQIAIETARLLGQEHFAIITGGGPGIMEAANRGAREGGTVSI